MTEYTYRIYADLDGGRTLDLGTVGMISEAYGELNEGDAVSLALNELALQGAFYRFRGQAFPKADLQGLRAELVQVSDLSAAEPVA